MKRFMLQAGALCALLVSAPFAFGQGTIYWGGSSALWTNAANWVGGAAPKNGKTGVIASGQAQINSAAGLYDTGLGETAPAEILVQSGGTLLYMRYNAAGAASMPDHNLVLDGGTLRTEHPESSDYRYDYEISVRNNSVMAPYMSRIDRSGQFLLYGELKDYDATHTGVLTKQEVGRIVLLGNVSFTGGWSVQAGLLDARTTNGVGSGDVTVGNGGSLQFRLPADTDAVYLPNVTVQNGGFFVAGKGTFFWRRASSFNCSKVRV